MVQDHRFTSLQRRSLNLLKVVPNVRLACDGRVLCLVIGAWVKVEGRSWTVVPNRLIRPNLGVWRETPISPLNRPVLRLLFVLYYAWMGLSRPQRQQEAKLDPWSMIRWTRLWSFIMTSYRYVVQLLTVILSHVNTSSPHFLLARCQRTHLLYKGGMGGTSKTS